MTGAGDQMDPGGLSCRHNGKRVSHLYSQRFVHKNVLSRPCCADSVVAVHLMRRCDVDGFDGRVTAKRFDTGMGLSIKFRQKGSTAFCPTWFWNAESVHTKQNCCTA